MLSEPLLLIILLLFLIFISLVLLVWFMTTAGQRTVRTVTVSPKTTQNKQKQAKVESHRATGEPQAAKLIRPTREPKLPAAEEAKLRLSNDQVRGLHAKATRRQVAEETLATEPPSVPKNVDDDTFEKFIHSKNDDLKF
jgi:Na+-transporting methylmalonyl-CoA/oxaloacetate decarboxylase gamma subunit